GRAMPWVAGLCVVLALWFAYASWQLFRDDARRAAITHARNAAVDAAHAALTTERRRLTEKLALPSMQAALAAGDLASASRQ
ncbi:hypothetical protein ABTB37_19840, partial [Acinetobacter baumannii]